jgi:hypothetical protein
MVINNSNTWYFKKCPYLYEKSETGGYTVCIFESKYV